MRQVHRAEPREAAPAFASESVVANLRQASRCGGLAVTLIGLLASIGWIRDITLLKSLSPTWARIKVNTALCFILLGFALRLFGLAPHRRVGTTVSVLGAVVLVVTALSLSQDAFGWHLGIDELFVLGIHCC